MSNLQQQQQQQHHQTLLPQQQQQHYYDQQQQQQPHHQQQHQQQQQQFNTLQYGRGCTAPPSLTAPHNRSMDQLETGSDQIQYNLSNCFPKSYTEYYQQHHHQQHQQHSQQQQHQSQQQQQQQSQKFHTNSASNAQLLNAIEHDYQPTYAVVERVPPPPPAPTSALLNTNPFLAASNFKKYDAAGEELLGSMQRGKRGKAGSLLERMDMDKKFYSLKFPHGGGNKLKKPSYNLNASLATTPSAAAAATTTASCKRHHSFAGGSHGDIESNGKPIMRLYDPPVYENVADKCGGGGGSGGDRSDHDMQMGGDGSNSSHGNSHSHSHSHSMNPNHSLNLNLKQNVNLATVQLHTQPSQVGGGSGTAAGSAAVVVTASHKKKHHHRQHQQKADAGADFQLMEPERLSIYRSDSGISNSSYESQLPALGQQRAPKAHKTSAAGLNLVRKPVYMNVEGQQQQQQQQLQTARAGSPAHNINSSYESGSSAPVTDPTSLSSCNSLYSSGTGTVSTRCNRHTQQQHHQKQPTPEITTPEDYEQYQLGHQSGHSASMLSVASSLSAASASRSNKGKPLAAAAAAVTLQQQLPHRVGPHEVRIDWFRF